ncbi:MAG: transporter substrate-binding domain-containing protein [Thiomonas sp.]
MIKTLLGLTVVAAATLSSAQAAELTGTLKKVKETNSITVGYRESSIPFSCLDNNGKPIGYAMELCGKVVDAVKTDLKMPDLKVNYAPVTSSNRIPLLENGTIDLECGSTTNSVARQKQVAFGPTYFVINVTAAVKKDSGINDFAQLGGKTIVTTSGTTSVPLLKKYEKTKDMEMNSPTAKRMAL